MVSMSSITTTRRGPAGPVPSPPSLGAQPLAPGRARARGRPGTSVSDASSMRLTALATCGRRWRCVNDSPHSTRCIASGANDGASDSTIDASCSVLPLPRPPITTMCGPAASRSTSSGPLVPSPTPAISAACGARHRDVTSAGRASGGRAARRDRPRPSDALPPPASGSLNLASALAAASAVPDAEAGGDQLERCARPRVAIGTPPRPRRRGGRPRRRTGRATRRRWAPTTMPEVPASARRSSRRTAKSPASARPSVSSRTTSTAAASRSASTLSIEAPSIRPVVVGDEREQPTAGEGGAHVREPLRPVPIRRVLGGARDRDPDLGGTVQHGHLCEQ